MNSEWICIDLADGVFLMVRRIKALKPTAHSLNQLPETDATPNIRSPEYHGSCRATSVVELYERESGAAEDRTANTVPEYILICSRLTMEALHGLKIRTGCEQPNVPRLEKSDYLSRVSH